MVQQDLAFARLMSNIQTELFQRRKPESNKAIKKSFFHDESIDMKEYIDTTLLTVAGVTYHWGPYGASPFVQASELQGVWGLGEWG